MHLRPLSGSGRYSADSHFTHSTVIIPFSRNPTQLIPIRRYCVLSRPFCFILLHLHIYIHVFHILHQQCITSCITLLSGTLSSVSYRTTLLGVISHYVDNLINTALWPRPYVAPATLFSVMTARRHGKETGTGQDTSIFRMRTQDRHTQTWLDLATTLPYATQTSSSPIKAQHGELLDRASTRQEA